MRPFNDHMLVDWAYSGPAPGVGARSTATAVLGGRREAVEIEVVEARSPDLIVERNVGADGRRVANGTYRLAPTAAGGTVITFEYAWQSAPPLERVMAPAVRAAMRRALRTSMARLAQALPATAPR